MDQLARFSINCHSSIRCGGDTVLWFDPYRVAAEPHDGDVIFVTHSHSDHLSPDDIRRVMKPNGVFAVEIGWDQGAAVSALFREAGFADVKVVKDLSDRDRVVTNGPDPRTNPIPKM